MLQSIRLAKSLKPVGFNPHCQTRRFSKITEPIQPTPLHVTIKESVVDHNKKDIAEYGFPVTKILISSAVGLAVIGTVGVENITQSAFDNFGKVGILSPFMLALSAKAYIKDYTLSSAIYGLMAWFFIMSQMSINDARKLVEENGIVAHTNGNDITIRSIDISENGITVNGENVRYIDINENGINVSFLE